MEAPDSPASGATRHELPTARERVTDRARIARRSAQANGSDAASVACGRRALLAGGATLAGGALAASTGLASAQSERHVIVDVADAEIEGGATTTVGLTLSSVPAGGLWGITIALEVDGDVARFTGEASSTTDWATTTVDLEEGGSASAVYSANTFGGNTHEGATDLPVGSVEVVGVGQGETEVGVTVRSLPNTDDEDVGGTAGSASLSVTSDASQFELEEYFDDPGSWSSGGNATDGGSGAGNESDGDASGGDGTDDGESDGGGSGDGGSSGDDGDSDVDFGDVGDGSDGSGGSGDGGGGGDGQPGFGLGAGLAALAAGVGARLYGSDDE